MAADGLQFAQTFSCDVVCCGDSIEGLQSMSHSGENGKTECAHFIDEIQKLSQLRSLELGKILLLLVMPGYGIEMTREIERRRIQRVEAT